MKIEKFIEGKKYEMDQEIQHTIAQMDQGLINTFYDLIKDRGYESEDGTYKPEDLEEAWSDALEECREEQQPKKINRGA